jgi:hypothetical protein
MSDIIAISTFISGTEEEGVNMLAGVNRVKVDENGR